MQPISIQTNLNVNDTQDERCNGNYIKSISTLWLVESYQYILILNNLIKTQFMLLRFVLVRHHEANIQNI